MLQSVIIDLMYNPNKYNYEAMSRVEIDGKRRYATPDGEKLPSVTTILDATKSEESKQALQNCLLHWVGSGPAG